MSTPGRVIGRWRGKEAGPTLIVVAGLHGNEPAGIPACRRVFGRLEAAPVRFSGELVALAGNLEALELGRRFADEDLNRIWQPSRLAARSGSRESGQRSELLGEVEAVLARRRGEASFLDLHTTSAPGTPFSVLADTPLNRRLAGALPGTMVLGLDAHLDGTFLNFINSRGFAAVGFEGGQHEDPQAVDAHELAVWQTLAMLGCVRGLPPGEASFLRQLSARLAGGPGAVSIIHRHEVRPGDGFVMAPGLRNLQPVTAGQVLAHDRLGEITAICDARVLMPLYQDQGNDGFFLAREECA